MSKEIKTAMSKEIKTAMSKEIKPAMDTLRKLFLKYPFYAHGWYCSLAKTFSDTLKNADIVDIGCCDEIHKTCNDAASQFMKLCFDVEPNNDMLNIKDKMLVKDDLICC